MFFMEYKFGKTQSIWAETSEQWDDIHPSWKIVGESPRRIYKSMIGDDLVIEKKNMFIENIFSYNNLYYKVIFSSGRESVGISRLIIEPDSYVIVEADRGEDCAMIKEQIHIEWEGEIKNIIRMATEKDIEILKTRRKQEEKALEKCISLVKEYGYNMEITRCEFQWDMKKITFYFKSSKRIDFRDLVKELFKYFKIRIWMSMENRNCMQ